MKIGKSLSFCVGDVARGDVDISEVSKIVCACRPAKGNSPEFNFLAWEETLDYYSRTYWDEYPKAREIANTLLQQGKIDFPRLRGEDYPDIALGHWEEV